MKKVLKGIIKIEIPVKCAKKALTLKISPKCIKIVDVEVR